MNTVDFTSEQLQEINRGIAEGLNVFYYAKPEFLAIQMREIRLGLQDNLPVESYASSEYDWLQMSEIRLGLLDGIEVEKYAEPYIPFDVMRQIRLGLKANIDLSMGTAFPAGVLKELRLALVDGIDIRKYIWAGYDEKQLQEIRLAMMQGVQIEPYLKVEFRGSSIREIALGLEKGLDVSAYADEKMNWQQMREIRLGLEDRLSVERYRNPWFSWQQMREIRLGLEEELPVESYARLMYTSREMKKRRLLLLKQRAPQQMSKKSVPAQKYKEDENFALLIPDDGMSASVFVTAVGVKLEKEKLLAALESYGIVYGIKQDVLERLEHSGAGESIVVVAEGSEPKTGTDAWYELFFERELKKIPKVNQDGTVDYQNIKWFEIARKGQIVVRYHEAGEGMPGMRVTGEVIPGKKGNSLPPLRGRGFDLLPDKSTYISSIDGKIDYSDGKLEITNVLILDSLTRADPYIDFNGSVYVKGTVGDGVRIKAEGDILIEGHTEGAELLAKGDVILKRGNNAGGKGNIRAKGNVYGTFFENARITAGGDIKANYCLNSDLESSGSIEMTGQSGILAGGRTHAALRIESYAIGNSAGLTTLLYVGREAQYLKQKNELEERADSVEKELSLLRGALRDFQQKYTVEERNNHPLFLKIEAAIYTKRMEQKEIQSASGELKEKIKQDRTAKVVANGTIYTGTRVEVNRAAWQADKMNNVTLMKKNGSVIIYRNR